MFKPVRIGASSLVLGLASTYLISLLKLGPYSSGRDRVTDILSLPGGLVAGAAYSEGVHTGAGSPDWAVLAFLGNLGFYSVVWFGVINLMRKLPLRGNKLRS